MLSRWFQSIAIQLSKYFLALLYEAVPRVPSSSDSGSKKIGPLVALS